MTSDNAGFQPDQFQMAVVAWLRVQPRFGYENTAASTTLLWFWKDLEQAYRCIYYPLDLDYLGPPACNGGCNALVLPGSIPAKMWLDAEDRPAASFATAIDSCRQLGGHLASDRDLAEAIRHGLPNGRSDWIWTSDAAQSTIDGGRNAIVVRWQDVELGFSDLYQAHLSWDAMSNSVALPYRCVWTNELR